MILEHCSRDTSDTLVARIKNIVKKHRRQAVGYALITNSDYERYNSYRFDFSFNLSRYLDKKPNRVSSIHGDLLQWFVHYINQKPSKMIYLWKLKKMFFINLAELVSTISAVKNSCNVMRIYRRRKKIGRKYSLQLRFCKIKTGFLK